MNLLLNKELLTKALSSASRIATGRLQQGPRSGVKIESLGPEFVQVSASELDLSVEAQLPGEVRTEGKALVPARLIFDVIRSMPGEEVELRIVGDHLQIRSKQALFEVLTYSPELFPPLKPEPPSSFKVDKDSFFSSISQVEKSAAVDETRPVLTGILFESREQSLRLVATDSYRLSIKDLNLSDAKMESEKILVPARALGELRRIGSEETVEEIKISLNENTIHFTIGSTRLIAQLISESFPDYTPLIPTNFEFEVRLKRGDLLEALKRVRILAKEVSSSVRISTEEGGIVLSANNIESGNFEEHLEAKVDPAGEQVVAFNPQYLNDGVEAVKGEDIAISVVNQNQPALIWDGEDREFQYLLMPVRIA